MNHLPPKFLIKHVRTNPMVQKSQLCLNRIMDTYEHIILPPDNTASELGGVKRLEINRDDIKFTEPEDIDPGPNVKVFDQMVSILGLEFHISPGTIERLNRGPPHGLPHGHGPMGGFFKWELVVFIWCDFSKTWEMTVKTAITIPMGTNSNQGTFKLPFKKVINLRTAHLSKFVRVPYLSFQRLMTKHLKIHIHRVPPQSFKVSYHLPKITKNLTSSE